MNNNKKGFLIMFIVVLINLPFCFTGELINIIAVSLCGILGIVHSLKYNRGKAKKTIGGNI